MKEIYQSFHTLILAAGNGERFGGQIPKQYEQVNGIPALRYSILTFLKHPALKSLKVVIHPQHQEYYRDALSDLSIPTPIIGGNNRKESCHKGLLSFSDADYNDPVLVHDAARPLVSLSDINAVLDALNNTKSVSLGTPVVETLRRSNSQNELYEIIDRKNAWSLQTPQGFYVGDLKSAHEQTKDQDIFTDDCGVMEACGHKTYVIKGSRQNIKLTWPEDLRECENIMKQNNTPLIGQGFDVHAFSQIASQTIRLGGIDVPCDRALEAHSDGDVALHALTDALLGAIGEGDIGLHFPPSDPQWKDKDSTFFLKEAYEKVKKAQCEICNVDLTIICEIPKIGPVRNEMQQRIANLLKCNLKQINIKATTTEKLGFTGRKEGIAVQAAVMLLSYKND